MADKPATILVIDDEDGRRLTDRLRQQGHEVVLAESAARALDLLGQRPFDLVLLDALLPEEDAGAVLEQLAADPDLGRPPVVVLAPGGEADRVAHCLEMGAVDYVLRPVDDRLLQFRLEASLQRGHRSEVQALQSSLEEALQAKSAFISFISHELKNPMASIFGYTKMLQQGIMGPVNDMQAQFLDTIHANVVRMDTLVSNLSDINKVEAGRIRLELGPVAVAEVVKEVAGTWRERIEEKDQTLELELDTDLPPVRADRERLAQVLDNLLSNAQKFTLAGGRLWIRATRDGGDGQGVHVAVEDTGVGITEADQERIFAQFFRARDDKTQEVPGAGLGLHIAKKLVELQGGEIWFESEHGRGSTFHVTLPVAAQSGSSLSVG